MALTVVLETEVDAEERGRRGGEGDEPHVMIGCCCICPVYQPTKVKIISISKNSSTTSPSLTHLSLWDSSTTPLLPPQLPSKETKENRRKG